MTLVSYLQDTLVWEKVYAVVVYVIYKVFKLEYNQWHCELLMPMLEILLVFAQFTLFCPNSESGHIP